MAMIKCPECGKEISDKAWSCPNCGRPFIFLKNEATQNNIKLLLILLLVPLVWGTFACYRYYWELDLYELHLYYMLSLCGTPIAFLVRFLLLKRPVYKIGQLLSIPIACFSFFAMVVFIYDILPYDIYTLDEITGWGSLIIAVMETNTTLLIGTGKIVSLNYKYHVKQHAKSNAQSTYKAATNDNIRKSTIAYVDTLESSAKSYVAGFSEISESIFSFFKECYTTDNDGIEELIQDVREKKYKTMEHAILEILFGIISFKFKEHEISSKDKNAVAEVVWLGNFFIDKMEEKKFINQTEASSYHMFLLETALDKPHEISPEYIKKRIKESKYEDS